MRDDSNKTLTILIGGEAGAGILLSGRVLARVFSRGGLYTFLYAEYPSLIRGGHNFCVLTVSGRKVYSQRLYVDTMIALDETTLREHLWRLKDNCILLVDRKVRSENVEKGKIRIVELPLDQLLQSKKLLSITKNMIALGSLIATLGFDIGIMMDVINDVFKTKYRSENLEAARLGYEYIKENFKHLQHPTLRLEIQKRLITISGNEAIAIGALLGGMKVYTAYPITPVSSILHFLAANQEELDIVVVQAEDEIAAANIAIGAWYAGARAVVATSSPGFSLMCESIGLAGITETPLVIVMAQRQGPSTGLPTYTSQGDLGLVLQASHGEFPKIVIAPGDIEEALKLTSTAMNLAEKYQVPVIILVDRYLVESYASIDYPKTIPSLKRYYVVEEKDVVFKRYAITKTGISPFTVPGMSSALVKVNSLEHDEYGFFTEKEEDANSMIEKRLRKSKVIRREIERANLAIKVFGVGEETIVSWGSTKGPVLEAMNILKSRGIKMRYIQVILLAPFPKEKLTQLLKHSKRALVIENNATGQLANLMKKYLDIEVIPILKYSGRPFYPEEIIEKIEEVMRR